MLYVDIAGSTGLAEAARRNWTSIAFSIGPSACSLSRSWIIAAKSHLCGRRGDRDLAGTRRRDHLPSITLLRGDARRVITGIDRVRTPVRCKPADPRSPHFGPVIVGEIGDIKRAIAQRRRDEYRRRGWKNSAGMWRAASCVARGDGAVQFSAAVRGSRPRTIADPRPRRWHRRGRPRRTGAGLILFTSASASRASRPWVSGSATSASSACSRAPATR